LWNHDSSYNHSVSFISHHLGGAFHPQRLETAFQAAAITFPKIFFLKIKISSDR